MALTTVAWGQTPRDPESAPLDEIIVTARKIEEPARTVPMSVQVLSGEFLADANTDNLYDLQFNIPGLVVNNVGGFGARFALRGITDQGGTALSVATHVNGVYLGDSHLALGRLFDLERVEVLKGPQGTLYGRNSTGGSVNFITRAPQPAFEAAFESSYGSFATARAEASVNVPLGDSALRVAFAGSNGEGFIRNTVDDRRFAEDDFWGLRGSWRLIVDERLDVTITAQRIVDDGASGELWSPNPAFLPDPSDIHLTTVTLADPFLKTENDFASLDAVYDFGTLSLRSVTGFAHSDSRDRDDCFGLPFLRDCVREILPAKHRQFSQELQLMSAAGDNFDWLVGINYYDADDSTRFFQFTPAINPLPTFNYRSTSATTAYAVFGEASLSLAERWTVTGGLRYSHEERLVSSVGTGTQDNPVLRTADSDWGRVSWRVNLTYAATPDTMLYTGVSTGFKSGGVTTQRLAGGEFDRFDPESLTAYTLGIKTQSRNRRVQLDAEAFVYDFDDMQISSTFFDGGILVVIVDNAAKAEIYGVDLASTWLLSDRFRLATAAVWLPRREFSDFRDNPTGGNLSGNKVSRAPEWTGTVSAEYERPVRDIGTLSARAEYNLRTRHFFTKENNANEAQGDFGLLNLQLEFEHFSGRWYVFAAGRNLTDEDYFHQVFIQSAPGPPRNYEAGFGVTF